MFEVIEINTKETFKCYGWITGGDGKIYGVCSKKGEPFMLILYSELRPFSKKHING